MKTGTRQTLEEDLRSQLQDYGLQFDPVCGLPNQFSFRASIREVLDRALEQGYEITLVWVDMLNFRREYSIGGEEGLRRLVCTVADALSPWVRDGELVCRFADRCFLLALKRDTDTDVRLNAILDSASHRHQPAFEGKPEIATGVACFPRDATTSEDLIRFASLAAESAARTRSRAAVPFHPKMSHALLHERSLERDLRIALEEGQLSLAYQPQIDLVTGNVLGVESLTRWNHPVRGFVSPAQFIPVAEQSDLIDEIFSHSLRQLLADAAVWRSAGIVLPTIAVNASAANIRREDFVANVERELAANPLGVTQLEVEVTESILMEDEDLFLDRLRALRSIGVKVSLDDFGTRYTGFNSLKGLPLNAMKIDRCFVHWVDRSTQAQSLCRTIVTMARHLKLGTVAEGIETVGELRSLKKLGCQAGQGYLFQRPVPSREFILFLQEWPERKRQSEFAEAFLDKEIEVVDTGHLVEPVHGVI